MKNICELNEKRKKVFFFGVKCAVAGETQANIIAFKA